jgi:D-tyrosyl-tRNA(Tyr) deacylase
MRWLSDKILKLRVFDDKDGKMNLSVEDIEGEILVVPQFTLYGQISSGTRPSYSSAAKPNKARELFEAMIRYMKRKTTLPVKKGVFGAYMDVQLSNDGPVTLVLDK